MNLTRTPATSDPETLRQKHPHIEEETKAKPKPKPAAAPKAKTSKAKAKAAGNVFNIPKPAPRKQEKKQTKDIPLSLPKAESTPPPSEPKKRKPKKEVDDDDEEEEEGEDPLEMDWGSPKGAKADFSPAFKVVAPRRFEDYMNQRDSEADEADEDSEDGTVDRDAQLPSPVKSRTAQLQSTYHGDAMDVDDRVQDDDDMAASLEDDLEKELENAFEDLENSQNGTPDAGDESEISEED